MINMDHGFFSSAGNRYQDLNQDFGFYNSVTYNKGGPSEQEQHVACVLDGHGLLGEQSSRLAGEAIYAKTESILKNKLLRDLDPTSISIIIKDIFITAHERALAVYDSPPNVIYFPNKSKNKTKFYIKKKNNIWLCKPKMGFGQPLTSGTTCTLVIISGDKLICANVGDSSAVLGSLKMGQDEGAFEGRTITVLHDAFDRTEAIRIVSNHRNTTQINPMNGSLYFKYNFWGGQSLAMTRALGHKYLQHKGVSPNPTIKIKHLDKSHCCVILGSDGLWEALSAPHEAVSMFMSNDALERDIEDLCKEIVLNSTKFMIEYGNADNTTIVAMRWTHQNND